MNTLHLGADSVDLISRTRTRNASFRFGDWNKNAYDSHILSSGLCCFKCMQWHSRGFERRVREKERMINGPDIFIPLLIVNHSYHQPIMLKSKAAIMDFRKVIHSILILFPQDVRFSKLNKLFVSHISAANAISRALLIARIMSKAVKLH